MSRSVLVTGASKGIGRAIACQLAADGFNIGVHYHRDAAGAQETLNAIVANGGNGRLLSFDVANREQCREVLEHEIAQHGAWYGVVSNAGIARDAAFPALSDDDWDAVIHTNLDSFYNVIQPCIMPMIGVTPGRTHHHAVLGFRRNGQSRPGELQCCQSRNYRRNKSTGYRTREAQNHRQLHRAGAY
ncbi:hypothetical protein VEE63_26010 [Escherichia coli]|nr:hypothetical protein VEE63_26010 [Escherichia coli]